MLVHQLELFCRYWLGLAGPCSGHGATPASFILLGPLSRLGWVVFMMEEVQEWKPGPQSTFQASSWVMSAGIPLVKVNRMTNSQDKEWGSSLHLYMWAAVKSHSKGISKLKRQGNILFISEFSFPFLNLCQKKSNWHFMECEYASFSHSCSTSLVFVFEIFFNWSSGLWMWLDRE